MQGRPLREIDPRALPLNETILPQYLKDLGYETRLVGKWHLGYMTKKHTPVERGFDSFFGYYNGVISYFNHTCSFPIKEKEVRKLFYITKAKKL